MSEPISSLEATECLTTSALNRYPRQPLELIEVERELFELPAREKVLYTKEVQTATTGLDEDNDPSAAGGVGTDIRIGPDGKLEGLTAAQEKLIREKIALEEKDRQEAERLRKEEESLEREIEEDIRSESAFLLAPFDAFADSHPNCILSLHARGAESDLPGARIHQVLGGLDQDCRESSDRLVRLLERLHESWSCAR